MVYAPNMLKAEQK